MTRQNSHNARSAPRMIPAGIGQVAEPAPACARQKPRKQVIFIMDEAANVEADGVTPKPKRPSLRDVALSVLARMANSGRREW